MLAISRAVTLTFVLDCLWKYWMCWDSPVCRRCCSQMCGWNLLQRCQAHLCALFGWKLYCFSINYAPTLRSFLGHFFVWRTLVAKGFDWLWREPFSLSPFPNSILSVATLSLVLPSWLANSLSEALVAGLLLYALLATKCSQLFCLVCAELLLLKAYNQVQITPP